MQGNDHRRGKSGEFGGRARRAGLVALGLLVAAGVARAEQQTVRGSPGVGATADAADAAAAGGDGRAPAVVLGALREAAAGGQAEAQYLLGMALHLGQGLAQDHTQAYRWFERADAGGDALAAFKRACYLAGECEGGPTVDMAAAQEAMRRAAEAGYARAQFVHAGVLFRGGDAGQARLWTLRAAEQGDPAAMRALASLHKGGHGGPPDQAAAYLWAERSLGDAHRPPDVQQQLAMLWGLLSAEQQAWVEGQRTSGWQPQPTELTLRARAGFTRVAAVLRASGR